MKTKKIGMAAALLMSVSFILSGCGSTSNDNAQSASTAAPAATAAANTSSEAAKPVILAVSFGTSYNDSREKTIGGIEKAIEAANPDYELRRAFTSQIIIDKLKDRDKIEIDNVDEAIERLVNDGVKTVVVQPTHVMSGFEYDDLKDVIEKNKSKFDKVAIGAPLLTSDEDYKKVAQALKEATKDKHAEGTAVVFMGHGTEHESNTTYAKLQEVFKANGDKDYFIGTVEATPSLDDIIALLKKGGYKKVVLEPLMVVAGDHANNDMAGDEDDSWKTILTNEGFEVECILKGMGEIPEIQEIYVSHVKDAVNSIK